LLWNNKNPNIYNFATTAYFTSEIPRDCSNHWCIICYYTYLSFITAAHYLDNICNTAVDIFHTSYFV